MVYQSLYSLAHNTPQIQQNMDILRISFFENASSSLSPGSFANNAVSSVKFFTPYVLANGRIKLHFYPTTANGNRVE